MLLITVEATAETVAPRPNTKSNIEVAKLQAFDKTVGKILVFLTACKLFIRMRMRGDSVKKQIQWILSYMQRELADVWKENILRWRSIELTRDSKCYKTRVWTDFD